MSWFLIRHGRTEGNDRHAYIGSTDEALSEAGKSEIETAISAGFYPSVEQVYVSPLLRCRQTASLIYPKMEAKAIDGFREMDFGRFEGKTFEELQDDALYIKWINSGGSIPFPAGEGEKNFQSRVISAFASLWEQMKDSRVALVVHGGTIMTIMDAFFSNKKTDRFSYRIGNGDYYVIPEGIKKQIHEHGVR